MKFFTFEWWCRRQSDGSLPDPGPAYEAHVREFRDQLPAELLRLDGELSIHDARLRQLTLDVAEQTLVLLLDGDEWSGGAPQIALRFGGVTGFNTTANGEMSLPGASGYGHLGYWELDLAPGGYEVRMLYSTGIEMSICFREIAIETAENPSTRECSED